MNKKYFKKVLLISLIFSNIWLLIACVDSFDAGLNTNIKKLVVDGEITNKPGPYRVSLQQSSPFGSKDFSPPPFNATVKIIDNLGNSETLTDLGFGVFETRNTQGVIGRSYTLEVKIGDNKLYRSTPQTIRKPVAIDKIYSEYVPYKQGSSIYLGGEFHVFLDATDPSSSGDYYRWNYTRYDDLEICLKIRSNGDSGPIAFQNRCCEPCWEISPCLGCIYLGNDQYNNGKKITRQFIGKFSYNSIRPSILSIEQKSITKENYFYWKEIDSQINNSGGIFDTPPANIQGNVYNITDPNDQVLGFFAASGVQTFPYKLIRSVPNVPPIILGQIEFIDLPQCIPCVESLYRTKIKPIGF